MIKSSKKAEAAEPFYRTIYKCVICGHVVVSGSYRKTKSETLSRSVVMNPEASGINQYSSEPHMCKNGSLGVGTFAGMERVVEEKEPQDTRPKTSKRSSKPEREDGADDGVVRK